MKQNALTKTFMMISRRGLLNSYETGNGANDACFDFF